MKNFDERIASIHEKASIKTIQIKKKRKMFLVSSLSLCLAIVIVMAL